MTSYKEFDIMDEFLISGNQIIIILRALRILKQIPINESMIKDIEEQLCGVINQQKIKEA